MIIYDNLNFVFLKNNEGKNIESEHQGSSAPSTLKQWESATFKGDNDGKMTEKFKRLMGIKGDNVVGLYKNFKNHLIIIIYRFL